MWYLAWMLGVASTCSLAIISVVRYEFKSEQRNASAN
ncbi:cytochrome bd-I oxidase subunit CydX [Endozoicomonas arenosclerae]|nr:cytochrome bd-I oxidase subunit CydX [Endozoicomonas arenosclerae]